MRNYPEFNFRPKDGEITLFSQINFDPFLSVSIVEKLFTLV